METVTRWLRLALAIAAVDLAVSFAWWSGRGSDPGRVLQSIASWALGPDAPASAATWVVGVAVLWTIYFGLVAAAASVLAWRRPGRAGRWAFGAAYGLLGYLLVYQWWIPAWIQPLRLSGDPAWLAACVLLHAALFGPWIVHALTRPRAAGRSESARIFVVSPRPRLHG